VSVGFFTDSVDVRSEFLTTLSRVKLYNGVGVDREKLVWIDGHTEETRVCVDNLGVVAHFEIV